MTTEKTTKKTAAKKTPAKKVAAKKAPTKKTAAKKAPVKKTTASKKALAKKAPSKKAPAKKKASAKKAPAKKTPAKKAPAKKKAPVKKKTAAKKTVAKKAPAKKSSLSKSPEQESILIEAVSEWVEARPVANHSITLKQISENTPAPSMATPEPDHSEGTIASWMANQVGRVYRFFSRLSRHQLVRRSQYLSGSFQPKAL